MRPGIPGGMEDKMAKGLWDEAAERVLKAETYEQAIDTFAFEEALAWRYDWVSDEKLARNIAAKWDKTAKEILEDVVALRRKRTEDIEARQEAESKAAWAWMQAQGYEPKWDGRHRGDYRLLLDGVEVARAWYRPNPYDLGDELYRIGNGKIQSTGYGAGRISPYDLARRHYESVHGHLPAHPWEYGEDKQAAIDGLLKALAAADPGRYGEAYSVKQHPYLLEDEDGSHCFIALPDRGKAINVTGDSPAALMRALLDDVLDAGDKRRYVDLALAESLTADQGAPSVERFTQAAASLAASSDRSDEPRARRGAIHA